MHASLLPSHNLWALLSPSCNSGVLWPSGRASFGPLMTSASDDTVMIYSLSTLISPLRLSLLPSDDTLCLLCHWVSITGTTMVRRRQRSDWRETLLFNSASPGCFSLCAYESRIGRSIGTMLQL